MRRLLVSPAVALLLAGSAQTGILLGLDAHRAPLGQLDLLLSGSAWLGAAALSLRRRRAEGAPPSQALEVEIDQLRQQLRIAQERAAEAERESAAASEAEQNALQVAQDARRIAREAEVSRQKALEETGQALEVARARSNFVATMSHELRTPMNGVIGTTELLLETHLKEDQRSYAQTIQACGNALLRVINDILDFSKMDAGKMELEEQEYDVASLLEEVADLMAAQAHRKGVDLVCQLDPQLPGSVLGDSGRIRQVLTNLLSNAVKFTRQGEVVLRADLATGEGGAARIRFQVSDTGIGIPAESLGRIFVSYAQADASTPRRFGGTGLGLSISQQLVQLMGGELAVASEVGKGSTFHFTLALQRGQAAAAAAPEGVRGMRVLIVEDSVACQQALAQPLRAAGVEADVVGDSLSALQQAMVAAGLGKGYDLVLIDQGLPGVDGLQLAGMLGSLPRERRPRMVLTTLKTARVTPDELARLGIACTLVKPIRRDALYRGLSGVPAAEIAPAVPEGSGLPAAHPSPDTGTAAFEPAPSPALGAGGQAAPGVAGGQGGLRVLLADDNPFNQTLIQMQLQKLGCEVDVVPHGAAAVQRWSRGAYDIVLMDCQMPEMNGYQATEEIRRLEGDGSRIPIVALTADVMPGVRERCHAAGMDDYLSKPIRLQDLSAVLQRWGERISKVA